MDLEILSRFSIEHIALIGGLILLGLSLVNGIEGYFSTRQEIARVMAGIGLVIVLCAIALSYFKQPEIDKGPEDRDNKATGQLARIAELGTYPKYDDEKNPEVADIVFRIANSENVCAGFWLKTSDPGASATLQILLHSIQSQTKIRIYGYEQEQNRWKGSGAHICRLYYVAIP